MASSTAAVDAGALGEVWAESISVVDFQTDPGSKRVLEADLDVPVSALNSIFNDDVAPRWLNGSRRSFRARK